ncbi:MAG: hypothetical protein GY810_01780 [Aureispira sp.]|nr:hypothetical protein [Aureispira sp.]
MKSFISILITIYTATLSYAQGYDYKLVKQLDQTAQYIIVDQLQQLYTVADDYQLNKYGTSGKLLNTYNENSLGAISHIDVSNPLQLLVYYQEYNTIVFLDRTLSELYRVDLMNLDIFQVNALAISQDNNLWFYDVNTATLKKVNQQGEVLQESADLTLLVDEAINSSFLIEYNNRVYLNNPAEGIMVFDLFGGYLQTIELISLDFFQVYEDQLFYLENSILKSFDLNILQTSEIELPVNHENLQQVCIAQEHLYLHYPNKVMIYQIEKK